MLIIKNSFQWIKRKKAFQREVENVGWSWYKRIGQGKSRSLQKTMWIPCTGIHYRRQHTFKSCYTGGQSEELFPAETWIREIYSVVIN